MKGQVLAVELVAVGGGSVSLAAVPLPEAPLCVKGVLRQVRTAARPTASRTARVSGRGLRD